jgi:hypothetical protein
MDKQESPVKQPTGEKQSTTPALISDYDEGLIGWEGVDDPLNPQYELLLVLVRVLEHF